MPWLQWLSCVYKSQPSPNVTISWLFCVSDSAVTKCCHVLLCQLSPNVIMFWLVLLSHLSLIHHVLTVMHVSVAAVTKCYHGAASDHPCDPTVWLPNWPRLPHPDDQPGKLLRDLLLHAWSQDAPTDCHAAPGLCPVGCCCSTTPRSQICYVSQEWSQWLIELSLEW